MKAWIVLRCVILWFLVWLVGQVVIAQSVLVLQDSMPTVQNIGDRVFLFEDVTNTWGLQDAIDHDDQFKKSQDKVPCYGVTKSKIWVKLQLKFSDNGRYKLVMGYPNIDTAAFYFPTGKGYGKKISGWSMPAAIRDEKAADLIFDIPVCPLDTVLTYYISATSRIVILPLSIGTAEAVKNEQHYYSLFYLFYLGFVAMLFFYNLSIFLTSKQPEYLYYSSWVFFASMFFMVAKGYNSLFLPEWNWFFKHTNIISSLGGISIVMFVITTLRLKEFIPVLLKWFYTALVVYAMIILVSLLRLPQLAANLSQINLLFSTFLGLLAGYIMYIRKKQSFAKYYFFGFIVTLVTMFVYIMIFQKVLPFNLVTNNSIIVGSALEMMLFSFGLGAKINTINKEKIEAQNLAYQTLQDKELIMREQNVLLETKVSERTKELQLEKQKSDNLLLNILPGEVAEELMENGSYHAKNHNNVTVLFTDFVNFTGITEKLLPQELVDELHICFKGIDEIIAKYGMEKIKTIGDAYLAVCGLPNPKPEHAHITVSAAIEIIQFIKQRKNSGGMFEIKVGIHSGPVIAGIVGIKKFAFDIWGDTVNIGARMEQNGEAGKINISGVTYELVKNKFNCIYRGKIEAKNKGEIDMYFVDFSV